MIDVPDYPGELPEGHSYATFMCCVVILKERRRGRTNRLGWRFVAYAIKDHGHRIAPDLEKRIEAGELDGIEEVGAYLRRADARRAGDHRMRQLAADPANWVTGGSCRHQEQFRTVGSQSR